MNKPKTDTTRLPQDGHARVAELERRLKGLDAFAATISHEVRESLVSIGGFARAIELDEERLTPKSRTRLRRIAQTALQMDRVIDDAVALVRGERFEVEKCDVRLDEMVQDVLREVQPGYLATRLILSELPIIHADPVVVRHVLFNVIANAFKYSALVPEPTVEISLAASGALQVSDNGIGFSMNEAARMFEPFVRLTHDPAYSGIGLGLAAVKTWLGRHGGSIRAESREGGPTRFTISFDG